MAKKEYSSVVTHTYFNKVDVPSDIKMDIFLQNMLDRAEELLKSHNITMKHWLNFNHFRDHVIETWTVNDTINHKYWWMDNYVNEIKFMIWISLFDKYHKDWFNTGVLVDVPELPRKKRESSENVAAHFADAAVAAFIDPYL